MKKTFAILLIVIICLSFCLTSCNKNEEYMVLIDEKDITIDGKNTINIDDLYLWFDFINEETCSQLDKDNKFYMDPLDMTFFLCENSIEAHKYYMRELVTNSILYEKIILRINNMVIFCMDYTAHKFEFIEFSNFFDIDIEKSERIIEKDYLIEYIQNYDEEKVLNYFKNNEQYDCFMAKNGEDCLFDSNVDDIEYGYVITDKNKKTYLVLDHYLTSEEMKKMPSDDQYITSTSAINKAKNFMTKGNIIPLYRDIISIRCCYTMSYNLYDDSNIIWSDDMEWIELVKNILVSD